MENKDILENGSGYNRFNKFKVLAHAENIESFLNNKMPKPIVVDLELSNFCNQNCIWCEPIEYRNQNPTMLSPKVIRRAIINIAMLGAKMVRFCGGGEPMTNPFYAQTLKLAKQKNLGIIANSNGRLVSENLDAIVDYCDYFRVSLDAAKAETYQKLHQPKDKSDFENIVNGLRALVRQKKERHSNLEIGAAFLIHYKNYKEIPMFAKLMQEIGIDFVHFRPAYLCSQAENQKLLNIINKSLENVVKTKEKFERKDFEVFGITRKMEGIWFKRHWKKCYSPFFLPVLGANGKVYACCDRRDFDLGNFAKDGFAKIYRSRKFREKAKTIDVSKCARCTNKDLNEIIHFCFEKDYLKKDIL